MENWLGTEKASIKVCDVKENDTRSASDKELETTNDELRNQDTRGEASIEIIFKKKFWIRIFWK